MNKTQLRHEYLAKRKALTASEVKRRSQLIAWRFLDFLRKKDLSNAPTTVHTFLPIKRQNEIDTWIIISSLWDNYADLRIAVPVTNVATHTLHHYSLVQQTTLIENHWGIPEPATSDQLPVATVDIDIVLVPLLAFDQVGHRVGYGGGFYDRFLSECRADCLKIGLSLFDPVKQIEEIEPTDVSLEACITPDQVWLFS
ncbi:5-formyltetrahydrofolate cyclo-ligase [Spirosoma sp.]|uniref:5-formyltetrahydrofolate cyclo-ligase n=1 Tax=Spirosoma sp. TaxID=1899569 RepID=UPI003B3AB974